MALCFRVSFFLCELPLIALLLINDQSVSNDWWRVTEILNAPVMNCSAQYGLIVIALLYWLLVLT